MIEVSLILFLLISLFALFGLSVALIIVFFGFLAKYEKEDTE